MLASLGTFFCAYQSSILSGKIAQTRTGLGRIGVYSKFGFLMTFKRLAEVISLRRMMNSNETFHAGRGG